MFVQGRIKSVKQINEMITTLFEAFAEAQLQHEEQETKIKMEETTANGLKETIEVLSSDQMSRDS